MSVSVEFNLGEIVDIADRLENPDEWIKSVGDYLVSSTKDRILSTKTSPDGSAWAPWADSTAAARARTGGSLLYLSGDLYNSITASDSGPFVEVTSTVPYATFLQGGTPNMPARPFLGISVEDSDFIVESAARQFLKTV